MKADSASTYPNEYGTYSKSQGMWMKQAIASREAWG